jgi:hypothetical protein
VRRAGIVAAAVVGALAIAGVGAWLALFRDTAEPVTVGEAVTSFRTETEPVVGASPITPGVYVYATRGYEKTDALTGVTHRYPSRSTITVTPTQCGMSLTWRVLKGRSTEWIFCVSEAGWELRTQDERHTFFGTTETTTYSCRNTPIRPFGHPVGYRWRITCSTDGATERGTGRIVERRRWSLDGGSARSETLVSKRTVFTGDIRGGARYGFWFDETSGLPERIAMVSHTTNDSPVGDVHYEENVTLALTSLTPRR